MKQLIGYFDSVEECETFYGFELFELDDKDLEMLKKGKFLNFSSNDGEYGEALVYIGGNDSV